MGEISIIARRLQDGHVQFGWSGDGGSFQHVGRKLLDWYNTPDMVEYLFGLGQLERLVNPLTDEYQHWWYHTEPTGEPHYLGSSEDDIFSQIINVEYAYFYDTDGQWYYIYPGVFCIKVPLEDVSKYLGATGKERERDLFRKLEAQILRTIADGWYLNDEEFSELADRKGFDREQALRLYDKILYTENLSSGDGDYKYWRFPGDFFYDNFWLLEFLDRWVVVQNAGDGTEPGRMIMRGRRESREETIDWGKNEAYDGMEKREL